MLHRRANGRRPARRGQGHTSSTEARPDEPESSEPAAFNFEDWLPPDELAKLYHPEDGWHEIPNPGAASVSEPLRQAAQWWEDEPELVDFFADDPVTSWIDDRQWAAEPWLDDPAPAVNPVVAPAVEVPVMEPVAEPPPAVDDGWPPETDLGWDDEPAPMPSDDEANDWVPPPYDEPVGDAGPSGRPVQKFVFLNAATRYALDVPEDEMVEAAAETHSATTAAADEPLEGDIEPYGQGDEPFTTAGDPYVDGGPPVERKRHAHAARDGRRSRGSRKGRHVRTAPPVTEPETEVAVEPPPPVADVQVDHTPRPPASKRPIIVFGILAAVVATGATTQLALGGPSGSDATVAAGRPSTTLPRPTTPSTFVVLADPPETAPSLTVPTTSAPTTTSMPPTTGLAPTRSTSTTRLPVTTLPNTVTTEPATTTTEPVPTTVTTVFPTTTRPPTTTTAPTTTTTSTTTTTTQPPTTTTTLSP